MKVMRVYSGADGQSHFDEIEVEIEKLQPAEGIIFRHVPPDYLNSWHTAPRRQYVINLSGESEVEVGDGAKRRLSAGAIYLADDTTGQGHISRAIGNQSRVFVTIPFKWSSTGLRPWHLSTRFVGRNPPKRILLRQGYGGYPLRIHPRAYTRGFLRRRVKGRSL